MATNGKQSCLNLGVEGETAQDLFKHYRVLSLNTEGFVLFLNTRAWTGTVWTTQETFWVVKTHFGEAFAEAGVVKHHGSNSRPLEPTPNSELLCLFLNASWLSHLFFL